MDTSTPGMGSGLDIKSIVAALVKAEIAPLQRRQDIKSSRITTELSAISQVKSRLADLQSALIKLSDPSSLYAMKHSVTDPSFFNVTLKAGAPAGVYQIEVKTLAQQQSLASAYVTDENASIGSGNLSIKFGSYNSDNSSFTPNTTAPSLTLNISPGSSSLSAVRDAINQAQSDVTANIVQDSQGSRLTLISKHTGVEFAMQITGDISALTYDPTTANTALTQTMAATNSSVLINGLEVNQSTNQLENVITGATLNLKKEEIGRTVTLTVDNNKDQMSNLINDFLKQYNDTLALLTNLTGYNAETKQSGYLQGDSQLRHLKLNLSKWATSPVLNNSGPLHSLTDLGITTDENGFLEVNQKKFQDVFENNYKDIGSVFAKATTSSTTPSNTGGIAVLLNQFLDSYTGINGNLTQRSTELTHKEQKLPEDQKQIDDRGMAYEERYKKQWVSLDLLLSKLQAKSSTLEQLLNNIPQPNKKR